jgi:membrane protein implicated in regulation of membrane protease activity
VELAVVAVACSYWLPSPSQTMKLLRWIAPSDERPEDRRRMWSGRVLAKYWAMQLPATLILIVVLLSVRDVIGWPQWILWASLVAWVAKDAIFYPFVWRSYDAGYPMALPYRMEGANGVAVNRIDPLGFVRIGGELWRAELSQGEGPIEEGEKVRVKSRHGLILVLEAKQNPVTQP